LGRGGLFDDGEDFFFAEEEVDLVVQLHFRTGVLADENLVADFHGEGDLLTVLVDRASTERNDLGFLRLLLGGVRDDDAALDFFSFLDALHEHAICEGAEEIKGGIIIPDSAKEKPQEAKVVALGTGAVDKDGKKIPFSVKVGDKVLIGKYAGSEVKLNDEIYLLLREEEVLAVIE